VVSQDMRIIAVKQDPRALESEQRNGEGSLVDDDEVELLLLIENQAQSTKEQAGVSTEYFKESKNRSRKHSLPSFFNFHVSRYGRFHLFVKVWSVYSHHVLFHLQGLAHAEHVLLVIR